MMFSFFMAVLLFPALAEGRAGAIGDRLRVLWTFRSRRAQGDCSVYTGA